MVDGKEILTKAKQQALRKEEVSATDVLAWLLRHAGFVTVLAPVIVGVLTVAWVMWFEPRVKQTAQDLDKPIIIQVDTLSRKLETVKRRGKETHYIVKKMELIQRRTAPKEIVREAAEDVEIEKILDTE